MNVHPSVSVNPAGPTTPERFAQSDLFYDYRTNVAAYPVWQVDARKTAAAAGDLGKYDLSFDLSEPEAYRRDVPNAEVHVLEVGPFALDTAADEIAALIRAFKQ